MPCIMAHLDELIPNKVAAKAKMSNEIANKAIVVVCSRTVSLKRSGEARGCSPDVCTGLEGQHTKNTNYLNFECLKDILMSNIMLVNVLAGPLSFFPRPIRTIAL